MRSQLLLQRHVFACVATPAHSTQRLRCSGTVVPCCGKRAHQPCLLCAGGTQFVEILRTPRAATPCSVPHSRGCTRKGACSLLMFKCRPEDTVQQADVGSYRPGLCAGQVPGLCTLRALPACSAPAASCIDVMFISFHGRLRLGSVPS